MQFIYFDHHVYHCILISWLGLYISMFENMFSVQNRGESRTGWKFVKYYVVSVVIEHDPSSNYAFIPSTIVWPYHPSARPLPPPPSASGNFRLYILYTADSPQILTLISILHIYINSLCICSFKALLHWYNLINYTQFKRSQCISTLRSLIDTVYPHFCFFFSFPFPTRINDIDNEV